MPRFYDQEGYPANKPPWGTLNCIDWNTGQLVWKKPLGEYPGLAAKGGPATGTENYGGAIVTAGQGPPELLRAALWHSGDALSFPVSPVLFHHAGLATLPANTDGTQR